MTEILTNLGLGFSEVGGVAFLLLIVGVVVGVILCSFPGVSSVAILAIALPATIVLPVNQAVATFAGLYVGCTSGMLMSAIFAGSALQSPAAPDLSAARRIARSGRPMVAVVATMAGFAVAAFVGLLVAATLLPWIGMTVLAWGPAEFCVAIGLAMFTVALFSNNPLPHSFGLLFFGMLTGLIGLDLLTGQPRLTLGAVELMNGVSVSAAIIGLFGIGDIIYNIGRGARRGIPIRELDAVRARDFLGGRSQKLSVALRGGGIGGVLGLLPGSGPQVASRIAVSAETRISRSAASGEDADLRATVASAAASSASLQSSLLILLCLGIPGSATIAILAYTLLVHGLAPGPDMVARQSELIWMIIAAIFLAIIASVVACILLSGLIRRVSMIDYRFVYPAIFGLCVTSVFASSLNAFDIYVMCAFGAIGYLLRTVNSDATPLLLGMLLIHQLEQSIQRMMLVNSGEAGSLLDGLRSEELMLIPPLLVLLSLLRIWQQRQN